MSERGKGLEHTIRDWEWTGWNARDNELESTVYNVMCILLC